MLLLKSLLKTNTTTNENVAIGYQALQNNTARNWCWFRALNECSTGSMNTAVGEKPS